MDNRHFIDFAKQKNRLENQEQLCLMLRQSGKFGKIEDEQVNPMTIRLLLAQDALNEIQSFTSEIFRIKSNVAEDLSQFTLHNSKKWKPTFFTAVSSASGSTESVPGIKVIDYHPNESEQMLSQKGFNYKYEINPDIDTNSYVVNDKKIGFYKIHKSMYQFFTNFASALDRIAREIKTLYNIPNLKYWSFLNNPNHSSNTVQKFRKKGYSGLTSVTTGALAKDVSDSLKYRHRIAHEGIVELKFGSTSGKVFLPEDPDSTNKKFTIQVDSYCEEKFDKLIKLLDLIYAEMLIDLK